jgi:S1-C subfamily serine protease
MARCRPHCAGLALLLSLLLPTSRPYALARHSLRPSAGARGALVLARARRSHARGPPQKRQKRRDASAAQHELDFYGRPASAPLSRRDGRPQQEGGASSEGTSVVKVYATHSPVAPMLPWTSKSQEESTGSGFAIRADDGTLCLLTNAHCVADAAFVEVRKAGDARKFVARRHKVAHECDLATLCVEEAAFWEEVTPFEFGAMPRLQDEVSVVGYPEGGEGVSHTVGVVSRIEIQRYAHSGASLLAIQIDAAINPGNSGGPALDEEGRVIGVAFQGQENSQLIGYVIPVPTIAHFLDPRDVAPGSGGTRPIGFCSLGLYWQTLENAGLRAFSGLPSGAADGAGGGVLIRGLVPLSAAAKLLRRGDVLLELEGRQIASDGSFRVGAHGSGGGSERLSFAHLIHSKFPGESVRLKVARGDETLALDVPVAAAATFDALAWRA